jgi:mannose-6-phosphate isomerase-like protein (cupin superfamily)
VKLVHGGLGTEKLDLHLNMLIPRGNRGQVHYHTKSDNVYIVRKGTGELFVDGGTIRIVEGDVVYIPAGVAHSLSNTSEQELQIFEIYSPAGKDYDFVTL